MQIFNHGSSYGQTICEYKTVEEITSKFNLTHGDKYATTFQLWSSKFKGNINFRKVELNPIHCNGYTFRYATDGWGLIQLYFGGIKDEELQRSHIGHFNEAGALRLEKSNSLNVKVNAWDWQEIQRTSRKLKYQIHNKMAVRKIGNFGILDVADKLEKSGDKFR